MGIGGSYNPFGHGDPAVDHLLGENGYRLIQLLANNLDLLKSLAGTVIGPGLPILSKQSLQYSGTLGSLGSVTNKLLPDDVEEEVISISTIVIGSDGTRYYDDPAVTQTVIKDGTIRTTLKSNAPANCAGAIVYWFLILGA